MSENYLLPDQPRSTFVTVLAWAFIVLSGLGVIVEFVGLGIKADVYRGHGLVLWWCSPVYLLIFASILFISIGLLRRCFWSRLCFVTFIVLAFVCFLVVIFLLFVFMSAFGGFEPYQTRGAFAAFFFLAPIVSTVLFIWIIKKLLSAPIKKEFSAGLEEDEEEIMSDEETRSEE